MFRRRFLVSKKPAKQAEESLFDAALIGALRRIEEAPREAIPQLLGELERTKALLWARLSVPPEPQAPTPLPTPSPSKSDRLLTAAEAGAKLGRSKWWIYSHKLELPRVPLPGGGYGFREASLDRWIQRRSS